MTSSKSRISPPLSLGFLIYSFLCLLVSSLAAAKLAFFSNETLNTAIGVTIGVVLSVLTYLVDKGSKEPNLKSLNLVSSSLFGGVFLTLALWLPLRTLLDLLSVSSEIQALAYIAISLPALYLSFLAAKRSHGKWWISIPFVEIKKQERKLKSILLDASVLADPRLIDLAGSGIVDGQLCLPKEVQEEWIHFQDSNEEGLKAKAKRALEVLRKLESLPSLHLKHLSQPLPEGKDLTSRIMKQARQQEAYLMTADLNLVQQSFVEGIKVINIHSLSNALKPIMQSGEMIEIKIQRYGKETRQGVGYLEDGTMVVVNGGAEFIGESIRANVLSVKHTSSGRMVFCNVVEEVATMPEVPVRSFVDLQTTNIDSYA